VRNSQGSIGFVGVSSCAIVLSTLVTYAAGGVLPSRSNVDRSLFPQAYGVLGDEHLMFPVDMSDWPVKIDDSRQLFVDDYLLGSATNVTRELHCPKPHPDNPIFRLYEKPWEHGFGHSAFVLRDEKSGKFKMWYNVRIFVKAENGLTYRAPTCYAESADGIHWTKPNLGIFKFGSDKNNNITLSQGTIDGLFYEPQHPEPEKRYRALVWHDPRGQDAYAPREGFYLYWSPDGLHWQGDNRTCIIPNGQSRNFPAQPCGGVGDTTNFSWDSKLKKYVASTKVLFRNPTLRTLAHSESDDLIHWTRPVMIMHRDGFDADDQLGELTRFPYESMWIGMLGVYQWRKTGFKQKYPQLAASRDGRHWYRAGDRKPFIPLGADDSWDPDFTIPARPGPILVGDELWFYYWGTRRSEREKKKGINRPSLMHIGLGTLRRDGFVSLNAGNKSGTVVTRPLTFEGKALFVNAEVGRTGYVKVALREISGKPVEPYLLEKCNPITGDLLEGRVTWKDRNTIDHPHQRSMRLVFELKNAKLYSFWIE